MGNSPARSAIDVGSVIADTYRIEALIGRGGMGSVFLASHARLPGKKVAIKMLHAELHEEEVLARFQREAQIASRLGHPNIVAVHDFNVTADGMPYLVLEYLVGESLAQRLKAGPLTLEQTTSIIRQVGSALAAAHREGIVHRDLKPHNIFLVPTEVDGRIVEIAKVLDFGISKIRGSQTVKTQESALLGTPQYMAPEQATGQHDNVDERTDVFALGAIVYEMLTGRPAFNGESIPEVVFKVVYEQPTPLDAAVPPTVISAVTQAMAKSQAERFGSVGTFVEALTGQPLTSFRPSMGSFSDAGAASSSQRVRDASAAALANTMGSGDHADARAATVASQSGAPPPVAPPPVVEAAPIAAPPAKMPPVWIAFALGGIAAIAGVLYVVMKPEPSAPSSSPVATAPADAPAQITIPRPALAEVPQPMEPPVGTKPVDDTPAKPPGVTKPADPKPKPAPPKPRPQPQEPTVDAPGDRQEAAAMLAKARDAMTRGEHDVATRLTNAVINSDAGPRQRAAARVMKGIIACEHTRDHGVAAAEYRALAGQPGFRKQLQRVCQQAGIDIAD